jgi:hypothetical protein
VAVATGPFTAGELSEADVVVQSADGVREAIDRLLARPETAAPETPTLG